MMVSLAVALTTQLLLPFPFGLIVAVSIFILFPLAYRRYVFKNGSIFTIKSKLKMMCITCGKKSNDRNCKRCGGNIFKAS
jgi:hypothetical protein